MRRWPMAQQDERFSKQQEPPLRVAPAALAPLLTPLSLKAKSTVR